MTFWATKENVIFEVKLDLATFWATYEIIWATLFSNIWSHWPLHTRSSIDTLSTSIFYPARASQQLRRNFLWQDRKSCRRYQGLVRIGWGQPWSRLCLVQVHHGVPHSGSGRRFGARRLLRHVGRKRLTLYLLFYSCCRCCSPTNRSTTASSQNSFWLD